MKLWRSIAMVAGLIVLALAGAGLYLTSRDWNVYRDSIANQLAVLLSRPVNIQGELRLVLLPEPELRVRDLEVMASLEEPEPLIRMGAVELRVDLPKLFQGLVSFDRLELHEVALLLHIDAQGRPNWALPSDEPSDADYHFDTYLQGRWGIIKNSEIVFQNDVCATTSRIALDHVEVLRERDELEVLARGSANGVAFDLAGTADPLVRLTSSRTPFALDLEGKVAAASVEITGRIANPADLGGVDLYVQADAPSLTAFVEYLDRPLPDLGPVTLSVHIIDSGGTLSSDDFQLQIGTQDHAWLHLGGNLRGADCGFGLSLAGRFGTPSVAALGPILSQASPELGRVEGSFELDDRDGTIGLERFELRATREGGLDLSVGGTLDDLRELDQLELDLELEAPNLATLGSIVGQEFPPLGPVAVEIHAAGSDEAFRVSEGRIVIGSTTFEVDLAGSNPAAQRPRVDGSISSDLIHLEDLEGLQFDDESEPPAARKRLFSRAPIEFGALHAMDSAVEVHADRVAGLAGLDIDELRADVRLEEGALAIAPIELVYHSGRVDAEAHVVPHIEGGGVSLNAKAGGIDLHRLLSQFQPTPALSGRLDASVELQGRGSSAHAIASTLEGRVELLVEGGTIGTSYANALILDLVDKLSSGEADREHVPLHCLLADLEVRDGVVETRTLLLDSGEVTIHAEGSLDLGEERIDLDVTPSPKDPGALSLTAPIRVTGPLLDPSIEVRRLDMVLESAQDIAVGVARPAWEWLEDLWAEGQGPAGCERIVADLAASRPDLDL